MLLMLLLILKEFALPLCETSAKLRASRRYDRVERVLGVEHRLQMLFLLDTFFSELPLPPQEIIGACARLGSGVRLFI